MANTSKIVVDGQNDDSSLSERFLSVLIPVVAGNSYFRLTKKCLIIQHRSSHVKIKTERFEKKNFGGVIFFFRNFSGLF